MTDLSPETVMKLAALAKLELGQEEIEYYRGKLSQVIHYFSELDKVNDSLDESWRFDVEGHPLPERKDLVESDSTFKLVLEGAPKAVGTSFQVPRIIE